MFSNLLPSRHSKNISQDKMPCPCAMHWL